MNRITGGIERVGPRKKCDNLTGDLHPDNGAQKLPPSCFLWKKKVDNRRWTYIQQILPASTQIHVFKQKNQFSNISYIVLTNRTNNLQNEILLSPLGCNLQYSYPTHMYLYEVTDFLIVCIYTPNPICKLNFKTKQVIKILDPKSKYFIVCESYTVSCEPIYKLHSTYTIYIYPLL